MFDKLHLLSQDVPEGGDGFRWKAHPYLRIAGSVLAGRLLLPTPGALAVLDVITGQQVGTLPVDREDYTGPVGTASSGEVVLEQRGDTVVALR